MSVRVCVRVCVCVTNDGCCLDRNVICNVPVRYSRLLARTWNTRQIKQAIATESDRHCVLAATGIFEIVFVSHRDCRGQPKFSRSHVQ